MLSTTGRRIFRSAIAIALVASLTTAAVALAHSGPGNGFGHHHIRYYRASGWVVPSANATTLTVEDLQGHKYSFVVATSTKYLYANGSSATASDAAPYHVVVVTGTAPTTSGGNPVASTVVIQLAEVEGIVKSDSGGTLTVVDTEGFTRQISTSSATCTQRRATVACGSIAAGSVVAARGTIASDGTTLDASRIQVVATSS
jgi:hypothetical protein